MNYFDAIPNLRSREVFSFLGIETDFKDEPFVRIEESEKVTIDMKYISMGVPHAVSSCYLRRSAYKRLIKATESLPAGYKFKIFDAWRSLEVQEELYSLYKKGAALGHDAEKSVDIFVSPPSRDILTSPPHCTGGAIDLTIVDESGNELAMGTGFDDFSEASSAAFFESGKDVEIRNNRRMLYGVMAGAGFCNLPSEWWHFDFGDAFWAFYMGRPAKYTGVHKESDLMLDERIHEPPEQVRGR